MGITLPAEVVTETTSGPVLPLVPVENGGPVTVAGVTLAVCSRIVGRKPSFAEMKLCRQGSRKIKDASGADTGKTEPVWRETGRADDISRALTAALISPSK